MLPARKEARGSESGPASSTSRRPGIASATRGPATTVPGIPTSQIRSKCLATTGRVARVRSHPCGEGAPQGRWQRRPCGPEARVQRRGQAGDPGGAGEGELEPRPARRARIERGEDEEGRGQPPFGRERPPHGARHACQAQEDRGAHGSVRGPDHHDVPPDTAGSDQKRAAGPQPDRAQERE